MEVEAFYVQSKSEIHKIENHQFPYIVFLYLFNDNRIFHLREAQKKAEDVYDKMPLYEIEEKFGKTETGRLDCF